MLVTQSVNLLSEQNSKIRYILTNSYLGRLLVASTDKGICAICFGDDDAVLEVHLAQKFPHREIKVDQISLIPSVSQILAYLNGETTNINLALDIQGTNFQWRVWDALLAIPFGCTRSYQEIGVIIGNSKAVRAVARACATNPVALVIPCHRVIRSNGDLGGYRWGLERKQRLLQLEQHP